MVLYYCRMADAGKRLPEVGEIGKQGAEIIVRGGCPGKKSANAETN